MDTTDLKKQNMEVQQSTVWSTMYRDLKKFNVLEMGKRQNLKIF
jgi:hypothetical protein